MTTVKECLVCGDFTPNESGVCDQCAQATADSLYDMEEWMPSDVWERRRIRSVCQPESVLKQFPMMLMTKRTEAFKFRDPIKAHKEALMAKKWERYAKGSRKITEFFNKKPA